MPKTNCPHCGVKLGNFLYADACPSCLHPLEHNLRSLRAAPEKVAPRAPGWAMRAFTRLMRFVES